MGKRFACPCGDHSTTDRTGKPRAACPCHPSARHHIAGVAVAAHLLTTIPLPREEPALSASPSIPSDAGAHPRPLAELVRIAGPSVATMASYTAMQFVDKMLVSRIGPDPVYVGAQGNGGVAAFVPISIAMGILTVINTYVSQNLGAGRPERGPAYTWNGVWIAVAFWLLILVPYGFALPWIFSKAGLDPRQAALAVTYGQICVFGSVLTMTTRAVSQFFYGMHRAGVVLAAGVAANVLNLGLNYVLIFGKLGMPAMGIAGSAIGTVIATGLELSIPMAVFLGPRLNTLYHTRASWPISWPHIRDLLRLGWPGGLMFGNEMVCWSYFMVHLVSQFGKHHATAGWIAHQYMQLSFMPAVGLSVACTAIVGKYMGMGRPDLAARRAWLGVGVAMGYMGLCGLLFVVLRGPLIGLFVDSATAPEDRAELIRVGSLFLLAAATFQLFDAVAMTLSGALRGAGDTVVPGVVTLFLSWGLIVGGGEALTRLAPGLTSLGPWVAASSYIIALSLFLLVRFVGGRWKEIRLVRSRADEAIDAAALVVDGLGPAVELAPPPPSRPLPQGRSADSPLLNRSPSDL